MTLFAAVCEQVAVGRGRGTAGAGGRARSGRLWIPCESFSFGSSFFFFFF